MLQSIEGYDANRIIELPGHEVVYRETEIERTDFETIINGSMTR